MKFIDNKIDKLPGDIIVPGNKISEFRASANKVKMIEPKLLKRLKKSEIIDLTQNNCIDAVYYKNSEQGATLEAMHAKIFLECADDDY